MMETFITRRNTLRFAAATAATALAGPAAAQQIPRADVAAPNLAIEKGASLRVLRPARFVEPDETIFRANTAKFQQTTGIETRVDFVGWEDIRPQTAVVANTGIRPGGRDRLGRRPAHLQSTSCSICPMSRTISAGATAGGPTWRRNTASSTVPTHWIGIPFGGSAGTIVYRSLLGAGSRVRPDPGGPPGLPSPLPGVEAHQQASRLRTWQCRRAMATASPTGCSGRMAARWSTRRARSHQQPGDDCGAELSAGSLSDLPSGTLSWVDPSNNRAYSGAASACSPPTASRSTSR